MWFMCLFYINVVRWIELFFYTCIRWKKLFSSRQRKIENKKKKNRSRHVKHLIKFKSDTRNFSLFLWKTLSYKCCIFVQSNYYYAFESTRKFNDHRWNFYIICEIDFLGGLFHKKCIDLIVYTLINFWQRSHITYTVFVDFIKKLKFLCEFDGDRT